MTSLKKSQDQLKVLCQLKVLGSKISFKTEDKNQRLLFQNTKAQIIDH